MKPPPFAYHDPATLDETLALLAEHREDAAVLAGGQSLIPLLNMRLAAPAVVIDIRRLALSGFEIGAAEVRVGATTRAADLEHDPAVADAIPCLVTALHEVGHPQIRNRTTIGGSVAHADPAAELPAVLVALGGSVTLQSAAHGERVVPAEDFFQGALWTAREPDELVTGVAFPRIPGVSTFIEVARRPGDFALVGACLCLDVADGAVQQARVALSGVADRPVRVRGAEEALRGRSIDDDALAEARRATSGAISPGTDLHASGAYRRSVAGVLVERGFRTLGAAA
jgi:carbon-monoxide dehydrogenase medium subunit